MAGNDADPYRVLGIGRGATEEEVKRAYRALAKRHHPDAVQGSVARFLEIQDAYEALVGGGAGSSPRGTTAAASGRPARRPAQPRGPAAGSGGRGASDAAGADAGSWERGARDAAGAGAGTSPGTDWARRPRAGSARRPAEGPPAGGGSAGQGTADAAGPEAPRKGGAGAPRPGNAGGRARTDDAPRGRRTSGRRRATLGSTSYDEAEEVFEPDWSGATWYGPASGTYWTINPKEYADPRKHGPEYQARARRQAGATPGPGPDAGHGDAGPAQPSSTPADDLPPAWRARAWTAASQPGAGRTAFEHETTPDEQTDGSRPRPGDPAGPPQPGDRPADRPARPLEAAAAQRGAAGPAAAARAAAASPTAVARPARAPGIVARVTLAVAGWLIPGLAVAALAGFPGGIAATLPLQAAGIVVLALVPRAAWAAAGGGLALVLAAVPIVAVVAALGGPFVPGGPAPEAAVVLAAMRGPSAPSSSAPDAWHRTPGRPGRKSRVGRAAAG